MNSRIKFFLILGVLVAGLAIFGYFKAIPGAGNQTSAPKIELTPEAYDFGAVDFGKVLTFSFTIKNSGNEILEIKKVATSCSCTTAKTTKDIIEPGQTAELQVAYDTAAMGSGSHGRGQQERIIFVKSNDPANAQAEVTITAFVK